MAKSLKTKKQREQWDERHPGLTCRGPYHEDLDRAKASLQDERVAREVYGGDVDEVDALLELIESTNAETPKELVTALFQADRRGEVRKLQRYLRAPCGQDVRDTIWDVIPDQGGRFMYECPNCGRKGHGGHRFGED